MKPPERINRILRVPKLTRTRMIVAFAVAVIADGLQLLLNAVGLFGPDQAIDVVAMLLTGWLLGFHWLLLPTFVVELIPLVDEFPTWTACVAALVYLRKRQQQPPPPPQPQKPVIDV